MIDLRTLVLIAISLVTWHAQAAPRTDLTTVDRFTDIGGGEVKWEQGTLYTDAKGFIPITSGNFPLSGFDLTPELLAPVSGKFVISLATWTLFSDNFDLSKFQRSSGTYSIRSVPYVIVSVKGAVPPTPIGSGEEVLKLNTSGTAYCGGVPPRKFSSRNDVDLWLHIDGETSAKLYSDQSLTSVVAELNVNSLPISAKKASFSAFSGDAGNHIVILGTYTLDAAGIIKSLKATLIQRSVIDACYSAASVTGKRIN